MKIAGIRFKDNWKVYDFDASGSEIAVGDSVIVESDRGQGFGRVVRVGDRAEAGNGVEEELQTLPASGHEEGTPGSGGEPGASVQAKSQRSLRKIIRKANEQDLAKEERNREDEAAAFEACCDLIEERELPMKLIRVEYSFDGSRATFFFFSENRVDFRDLVRELAHKLRTRIEMRQIGVRDVARMIGGFGPCGRELCCSSFLRNFEPVSIRMAKKQEMVLNPAKISGVCGRLLCCLSYEFQMYDDIKKDLAELRSAQALEKKEQEDRRAAEQRRAAERKLQEEQRRQEGEQKKEGGQRPEQRREKAQREQTAAGKPERKDSGTQQPAAVEPQQQKAPAAGQSEASGSEKSRRRKRRRFWRKKKGAGEGKPPEQG